MINLDNYTDIELSSILYYADYLSLRSRSIPVTNSPKYFFIFNSPVNLAYLVGSSPIFSKDNKYFKQSVKEYDQIRNKFGESGIISFIEDICNIQACGIVDWKRMLQYMHQYSTKTEKAYAFNKCANYLKSIKYTHQVVNDEGDLEDEECSRYVFNAERSCSR